MQMPLADDFQRAADLIDQADGLLICAGAGMGVDSGLPDFRGNAGFWKAYPALGRAKIPFADIASPAAFRADVRRAWGFYGHRLALYRHTLPHEGFHLLRQIGQRMSRGYFVFTSNVDGQFQKAGFDPQRIQECHGSIHHLQCPNKCQNRIWSANGFQPEIDESLCRLSNALPTCPECGATARPNIVMFNDYNWIDSRTTQQGFALNRWLSTVKRPLVIELGAGIQIATVRYFSAQHAHRLIRINPTDASLEGKPGISLRMGALAGLQGIANVLGLDNPNALSITDMGEVEEIDFAPLPGDDDLSFEAEQATLVMLTHVGLRRLQQIKKAGLPLSAEELVLECIRTELVSPLTDPAMRQDLFDQHWIQSVPDSLTPGAVQLLYQRNPLEHVERINFEITTRCNFACKHCRNGSGNTATETDIHRLIEAGKLWLDLGVRRFDFIGGEVARFGDGWLDLVQGLQQADRQLDWPAPLVITLFTSGWWLGQTNFEAAGKRYADEAAFLQDLAAHGLTHILFSIDGPAERHDDWRRHPGLFERILAGIPRVQAAGLAPRISAVICPGDDGAHFTRIAQAIYGPDGTLDTLSSDPDNHFSHFIDVANGNQLRQGCLHLEQITPDAIRCKAFFRPAPTLRIMANGQLGICPLMQGEEGYGNQHERPLVDILNHLHEAPLYRLHASGEIGQYLARIDPAEFANGFDHICALRVAVNRVALAAVRNVTPHAAEHFRAASK